MSGDHIPSSTEGVRLLQQPNCSSYTTIDDGALDASDARAAITLYLSSTNSSRSSDYAAVIRMDRGSFAGAIMKDSMIPVKVYSDMHTAR